MNGSRDVIFPGSHRNYDGIDWNISLEPSELSSLASETEMGWHGLAEMR